MTQKTSQKPLGRVSILQGQIVKVSGLETVHLQELVHFEEGGHGQIIDITPNEVTVMAFGHITPRVNSEVTGLGHALFVRCCPHVLGSTIDSLGNFIGEHEACSCEKVHQQTDVRPPSLEYRAPITKPLKTGVSVVDLLVPLARGQRQLILGDRKTGKTSFLYQLAKAQSQAGQAVVYVSIGKRSDEVKALQDNFKKDQVFENICLVVSSASDSASHIIMTPYVGMAVAEYLRDQGRDVIVIFDDLTTHAKYYREVALLSGRFPGRDSYPGDMFYTHARLLERAGNFYVGDTKKTASISCLPVAETREGELTNFIVSNLISITDGHLLFHPELFAQGQRPAIQVSLSVTRVGKQTQTALERNINYTLSQFLTKYDRTKKLSHFGAELTPQTLGIINRGDRLLAFLNQSSDVSVPPAVMVFMGMAVHLDWFAGMTLENLIEIRDYLISRFGTVKNIKSVLENLYTQPTNIDLVMVMTERKEELLGLCQR